MEYAFLADFDLLRDTRQDIRQKEWEKPVNRALRDEYFKIQRAKEEIERLNIEIKRLVTHIQDEDNYLRGMEEHLFSTDPVLAFQVGNYRLERTRFDLLHLRRLSKLANLPGFTGSLTCSSSIDKRLQLPFQSGSDTLHGSTRRSDNVTWEGNGEREEGSQREGDEEDEQDEEDRLNAHFNVLTAVED